MNSAADTAWVITPTQSSCTQLTENMKRHDTIQTHNYYLFLYALYHDHLCQTAIIGYY